MSLMGARGGLLGACGVAAGGGGSAVARTGSPTVLQNNATTSLSITIPSNASAIVVFATAYLDASAGVPILSALNFGSSGNTFTSIAQQTWYNGGNYPCAQAWILTSSDGNWPGSGTHTLTVNTGSPTEDGVNIVVQAYTGVNTISPIIDTDSRAGYDMSTAWTSSLTGVSEDDMGIIFVYRSAEVVSSISGNGQTQWLASSLYRDSSIGIAEKMGEAALYMSGASDQVVIAFALEAGA
jgi:hypothetical protein